MAKHQLDIEGIGNIFVEADSREEAIKKATGFDDTMALAMRSEYVDYVKHNAKRYGLTDQDMEALLVENQRSKNPGEFIAATHIDPPSAWTQFGAGAKELWDGFRATVAEWEGDAEGEKRINELHENEREIYDALDGTETTIGDLAEYVPAGVGFMTSSIPGLMAWGGFLGYTALQGSNKAEEQGAGSRAIRAAGSAAGAGLLGVGGNLLARAASATKNIAGPLWMRMKAITDRPGVLKDVLSDAATLQARPEAHMQRLGKAMYNKVADLIQQLPSTSLRGTRPGTAIVTPQNQAGQLIRQRAEAVLGDFQAALREATETAADGSIILNPETFLHFVGQKTKGEIRGAFQKDVAMNFEAAVQMARKYMQISPSATPKSVYDMILAVEQAPLQNKALMEAFKLAKEPGTIEALAQALSARGAQIASKYTGLAFRTPANQIASETGEAVALGGQATFEQMYPLVDHYNETMFEDGYR